MHHFARACLVLTPAFLAAGCVTSSNVNMTTCQSVNMAALFTANGPGVRNVSPSNDCMSAKLAVFLLTAPHISQEGRDVAVNYIERLSEKARDMTIAQLKEQGIDYEEFRKSHAVFSDAKRRQGCEVRNVVMNEQKLQAWSCTVK
jgi:hypothetical protein